MSTLQQEALRAQQLEVNCNYLLSNIDKIHDALCPDHIGTWQQRVEAAVKAAQKLTVKQSPRKESTLNDDASHLLSFLNDTCGTKFRHTASNLNLIKARLRERDVTAEGVEQMIRRQHAKWGGTEMAEYLRPSTLFRASKFENYYSARDLPLEGQKKRAFGDLCYDQQ